MPTIGRPRLTVAYVWITFLVTAAVFVQGFLFGAFYSGRGSDYIDIHGILSEISGYVTIILVVAGMYLAYRALNALRSTRLNESTID